MTTFMLELDNLHLLNSRNFIVIGITNVLHSSDTAIVRRFSLKKCVDIKLSLDDFQFYLEYLNKPLNYQFDREILQKLYNIYQIRFFTTGDIKSLYKKLIINISSSKNSLNISHKILELFETGFSTYEPLKKSKEN